MFLFAARSARRALGSALVLCGWCVAAFAASDPLLVLSPASGTAGTTASMSLSISGAGAAQLAGIQFSLSYPISTISGVTVTAGPSLVAAAKTISCAGGSGTLTCLAVGLNSNLIGDGVLAGIAFSLTATGTNSNIGLSAVGVSLGTDSVALAVSGAALTVAAAPVLTSLTCSPASLQPSQQYTCSVALSASSGVGGTSVTLSATAVLNSPAKVLVVPAGATSASFTGTVGSFNVDQVATVMASLNGVSKFATISLVAPLALSSVSCTPGSLGPSAASTCTVTLSKAAPAGGSIVTLASSTPILTVPASVTIPAGASSAPFSANSGAIATNQSATLVASFNGVAKTTTVSLVVPTVLSSLRCLLTTLGSNASTTCTVAISKAAPASGFSIPLSVNVPVVTAPTSVTVPANTSSMAFTVSIGKVTSAKSATLTASLGPQSLTVVFTLKAKSSGLRLLSENGEPAFRAPAKPLALSCQPNSVSAGGTVMCVLYLTADEGAAPPDVLVSSNQDAVKVPASIPTRLGHSRMRFEVAIGQDAPPEEAIIEARIGDLAVRDRVLVLPPNTPNPAASDISAAGPDVEPSIPVVTNLFNGAGKSAPRVCAPGSIATLVGKRLLLGADPLSEPSGNATELGGTRVLVNGANATVLQVSRGHVDFLCPAERTETALDIAVETAAGRSNVVQTRTQETAPGIFQVDSERGQALATFANSSDLAVVPNFRLRGKPAMAGDAITLWTTGTDCSDRSPRPPLIRVGGDYATVLAIEPAPQEAGVCLVTFAVPSSAPPGDSVPVVLEAARGDGSKVLSNSAAIAIEMRP